MEKSKELWLDNWRPHQTLLQFERSRYIKLKTQNFAQNVLASEGHRPSRITFIVNREVWLDETEGIVITVGEYSRIPLWDLKIIYKHYCETLPNISASTRLNFSLRDSRIKPHNYLQEQLDLDERVSLVQYFFHSVYRGFPKGDSSRKAYRCSYKNGTRTAMYYHVQECKFVHWRLNLF